MTATHWNALPTSRYGTRGLPYAAIFLAALFMSVHFGCSAPVRSQANLYERDLGDGIHDTTPVYPREGTLSLHRDGDVYECTMCHDGFRAEMNMASLQVEHADMKYAHGLNDHCLHCHNPKNPDAFVDHDGTEIPGDQSTALCAKCHGTTFRDWEIGIHGRKNGYWDSKRGPIEKLVCIQCHDPHAPQFPQMKPDPPPALTRFQTGREKSKL